MKMRMMISYTPSVVCAAGSYVDELVRTARSIASPGRGILAIDESNATCVKRLASIGLENTEPNRQTAFADYPRPWWVHIWLYPFLKIHFTNQLQMGRSLWTSCERRR
ncbi:unnamed protein product [Cuscuta campestris]|uniref:fructose-bisphosphate aldolase n=1 Tax=Cuscuta campestris TaxID=132261 RepID=A0A484N9D9_9ASTE|nr:unnamed protein product [Cuscuta campestris]